MKSQNNRPWNEHEDNEDKDAECGKNTCKIHANNKPDHNDANEISSTMDKKYGMRYRENMRARK